MKESNILIFFLAVLSCFQVSSSREIVLKVYSADSLIVEEYPMNKEDFDEMFPLIRKNRNKWRKKPLLDIKFGNIEEINKSLDQLGYKLLKKKNSSAYDFYKGEDLIEEEISNIFGFCMDSTKHHFIFFAEKKQKRCYGHDLVCIDGIIKKKLTSNSQLWGPFLIKNKFVWCEVVNKVNKGIDLWEGDIKNSSQILYTFSFQYAAGGMPVKFYQIGENWVLKIDQSHLCPELEFKSRIIVNGEDLCKRFNYSGMWCYHLIKGNPFFIFSYHRDAKFRISYNGREIPCLWYDYIGSNGTLDIQVYETMVVFDARRGKQRYYVEAGVYE